MKGNIQLNNLLLKTMYLNRSALDNHVIDITKKKKTIFVCSLPEDQESD